MSYNTAPAITLSGTLGKWSFDTATLTSGVGTQYTHIGAYGTVESGGTWRGALFIISTHARIAPPGTTGLAAYGTYLT